jgi:predicted RND superfamily exporter protein
MGPSVLAAALTTFCAASIMLFTVITFFQKFAQILLCTVVMATVGSMFVFTAITDALGPSKPTECVDSIVKRCHKTSEKACTKCIFR